MCRVTKLESKVAKLIVDETNVYVQEDANRVIAKVRWHLEIPFAVEYMLRDASRGPGYEYQNERISGTATGIAVCAEDDVFDVEKGKKIAVARAESHAYINANTIFNKRLEALKKFTSEIETMADNFNEKSVGVVDHNTRYIESVGE